MHRKQNSKPTPLLFLHFTCIVFSHPNLKWDGEHRKANILLWCSPGFPASLIHTSAFICSAVSVDCKLLQIERNVQLNTNRIIWSRAGSGGLGWWLHFPFRDCVVGLGSWNLGQVHDLKPDKERRKRVQLKCQIQQIYVFKKIRFVFRKVTEYLTNWVSPRFKTAHLKSTSGHRFRTWLYPCCFCERFCSQL